MVRYPILIFVIFLEIFDVVFCENVTPNKRTEFKNDELLEGKGILFDQDEASSEAKTVGKRRLFFNEGDKNSPMAAERALEINEASSRKRSNVTETQITEHLKGFNSWENQPNKFSLPIKSVNLQNPLGFPFRQPFVVPPNQNFNWGQRIDVSNTRKPQWNEGKNFQQVAHTEAHPIIGNNHGGSVPKVLNRSDVNDNVYQSRSGDAFNRVSMTTLNDRRMSNEENYNHEKVGEISSGYLDTSNMNYYNRGNSKGFWDANLHSPEKGVIINFNTECPVPRQYNNHMVHKFIFTPKPISTQPKVSSFHIPETAVISAQQMAPMYYL